MNKPYDSSLNQFILQTVKKEAPETVEQLVELVSEKYSISRKAVMEHVLELQSQGKLKLNRYPEPILSASKYVFSKNALWYWLVMIVTVALMSTIFFMPNLPSTFLYLRYALGSIFIFFLPGYCFIEVLFPQKKIDLSERLALSIGMNLTILVINGFILNYTPWGITLSTVAFSLSLLTMTVSTIAVFRKYSVQSEK